MLFRPKRVVSTALYRGELMSLVKVIIYVMIFVLGLLLAGRYFF